MTDFKKGDKVTWHSHGGTAHGHVERVLTSETKVGDHVAKASKEEPQYLVESDNGGQAAHKGSALTKA